MAEHVKQNKLSLLRWSAQTEGAKLCLALILPRLQWKKSHPTFSFEICSSSKCGKPIQHVVTRNVCPINTSPHPSVCHLIQIILSWIIIFIEQGSQGPQVGILCQVSLHHGSGLRLLCCPYPCNHKPGEPSWLPGAPSGCGEKLSDHWTSQSVEDLCDSHFDILPGGPSIVSCHWQVTAELRLPGSFSPSFLCFPSFFINKPWPATPSFSMEREQVKVGAMENFSNLQFGGSTGRERMGGERDGVNDNSLNSCCTIQLHYFS